MPISKQSQVFLHGWETTFGQKKAKEKDIKANYLNDE